MIKPPKIREQMVRLKTRSYTIRFWFSRNISTEPLIERAFREIKDILDRGVFPDTNAVAITIAEILPDGTPLAAMEVLFNSNHSGTVDYFEWP